MLHASELHGIGQLLRQKRVMARTKLPNRDIVVDIFKTIADGKIPAKRGTGFQ